MAGKYEARNAEGDHRVRDGDPLALRLLKEEHHRFRELFDAASAADGPAVKPFADELCMRLGVHMAIEEELLYPAVRPLIGGKEVDEGVVEHAAGKDLMAEIEQLDGTEPLYKSKVHVLGEQKDKELFEDAKAAHEAGKLDLDAMGERMRARQAELYDRIAATGDEGATDEAIAEEIARA